MNITNIDVPYFARLLPFLEHFSDYHYPVFRDEFDFMEIDRLPYPIFIFDDRNIRMMKSVYCDEQWINFIFIIS